MYYNRDLKLYDMESHELSCITKGVYGCVYYDNDTGLIFKVLNDDIDKKESFTIEMFDYLKSLNNSHLIKLYDAYANFDENKLLEYKKGNISFPISAYTTKYYEKEDINILVEPIDFLLYNLRGLEKLITTLSENNIYIPNMKYGNLIICDNTFILINIDQFAIINMDKRDLLSLNKYNLYKLYVSIIINSYKSISSINSNKLYKYFENRKINYTTDITSEVSKKLSKVNLPIDYYSLYV